MPKRTWNPKKLKRMRKHGFLKRLASAAGKAILKRRRAKGRASLAVAKKIK
ncbi:MAG: 50S ribosomal protein L34 [Candidatus Pacebacteria bacterium]|nr:50S ribosomal protein L34 [Candidatus Paceibacterota bacterium]PIR64199.1 MAG: 50S ribosomal protein L34 [Candidatus Pacebacteria bacterium CG10_big_fil_rev_8_21_14_0_10_40_26]PIZ79276.1 MAG: 50S ribosomal protein L34 [Candidatus Pacebacteria bacterium CG_4_10_14_0_2_um_filter_40_20]PJA68932.1 MAG: 50S ribosomal protein L34 [Candidatus Pacebacteria bacterium CG_4_9_14_3_um_filter_40_12]PJC42243.1 MAG: 50S ribosomal protein L34 [Candidatus Pacebacteria bacterium CG_4_9_14_0_2_um_filter_40_15]